MCIRDRAYGAICTRCGLDYREVEADGGQIGGKVTTEFMALAESGEADLVYLSLIHIYSSVYCLRHHFRLHGRAGRLGGEPHQAKLRLSLIHI